MTEKSPVAITRAPTFPVTIGGKEYLLSYTFRSNLLVKELTSKSLLAGNVWSEMDSDPALVVAILYAGLIGSQPEITYEQVQDMLWPSELGTVLPAIRTAWLAV